jgi:hypothetical protein
VPQSEIRDRDLFAYFGHHKCASTWIVDILWQVADQIGLRHIGVHDALTPSDIGPLAETRPDASPFDRAELRNRIDAVGADLVICHTADRQQADVLHPTRAFHVIRDPRDIIVSGYFSHRNYHPTEGRPRLQAHRDALRALSPEEGLILEMAFAETELQQIRNWDYSQDHVLELKMEDLVFYPYDGFLTIFNHLGLLTADEPTVATQEMRVWLARLTNRLARRPAFERIRRQMLATGEIVLGAVYAHRFEAKTGGRERGTENRTSHYRKGIAGDWVNHFTPEVAEAFVMRFDDLLVQLGYETDPEWVSRARSRA